MTTKFMQLKIGEVFIAIQNAELRVFEKKSKSTAWILEPITEKRSATYLHFAGTHLVSRVV